jgi:superfamily II DNA/RNA helicase
MPPSRTRWPDGTTPPTRHHQTNRHHRGSLIMIARLLCLRDVLGAAKTGSGKTLAFVVPVLEKLFREGWSLADGLAALIITPTRELALQIFEVRGWGAGGLGGI